jgi:RNA-directed DNA polymerase
MKEPHGEGLATHTDPESCGELREEGAEALTGAGAGRVLSRERAQLWDADAVGGCGRQKQGHRQREMQLNPARSQTPGMYGNTLHENREVLCRPAADGVAGGVGKSKDTRRR